MNQPPIPLEEIEASILRAIREFDWEEGRHILAAAILNTPAYMAKHFSLQHTIPSPSSVTDCWRMQWYKKHDTETDNTPPESWAMRAATGMVMEPWWHMILGLADPRLAVTAIEDPLEIAPGVIGSPDGHLTEINSLLELKSQTGWKFIYNAEKGIPNESPEHMAQCQLYMHGAGVDWTLYLAAAADPAFVLWYKKPYVGEKGHKVKDPNFKYPFFLLHWVKYDADEAERLLERMDCIQVYLTFDDPPPPEYNPHTTPWPCQKMCKWVSVCGGG